MLMGLRLCIHRRQVLRCAEEPQSPSHSAPIVRDPERCQEVAIVGLRDRMFHPGKAFLVIRHFTSDLRHNGPGGVVETHGGGAPLDRGGCKTPFVIDHPPSLRSPPASSRSMGIRKAADTTESRRTRDYCLLLTGRAVRDHKWRVLNRQQPRSTGERRASARRACPGSRARQLPSW